MLDAFEWVKVNKHLQSVGTATCDVSSLVLDADDLRADGNERAAFKVMSAARDVLKHRKLLRLHCSTKANTKPRRGKYRHI